jgi:hypothetical protein
MRAAALHEVGAPLALEELELSRERETGSQRLPDAGECERSRVRVCQYHAC